MILCLFVIVVSPEGCWWYQNGHSLLIHTFPHATPNSTWPLSPNRAEHWWMCMFKLLLQKDGAHMYFVNVTLIVRVETIVANLSFPGATQNSTCPLDKIQNVCCHQIGPWPDRCFCCRLWTRWEIENETMHEDRQNGWIDRLTDR